MLHVKRIGAAWQVEDSVLGRAGVKDAGRGGQITGRGAGMLFRAKNWGRQSLPGAVRAGLAAGLGQNRAPREKERCRLELPAALGGTAAAEAMHCYPPGHCTHTVLERC